MCSYKLPGFNNWPVMDEVRRAKAVCRVLVSKLLLWVWLTSTSNTEVLCLTKEKDKGYCFVSITDSAKSFTFKVWNLACKVKLLQSATPKCFFSYPSAFCPSPPPQCKQFQGILVIEFRFVMCAFWSNIKGLESSPLLFLLVTENKIMLLFQVLQEFQSGFSCSLELVCSHWTRSE